MTMDIVPELARRFALSEAAVQCVLDSLRQSGGTRASFDHPDLGGAGNWVPGTCTVGEAKDTNLQRRVAGLAAELAAIVQGSESAMPSALSREATRGEAGSLTEGESWWPASYGHPAAADTHEGLRFAYFPDRRRLLVQFASRIDAYDTTGQDLNDCKRDPASPTKLTFLCSGKTLRLSDLPSVPV